MLVISTGRWFPGFSSQPGALDPVVDRAALRIGLQLVCRGDQTGSADAELALKQSASPTKANEGNVASNRLIAAGSTTATFAARLAKAFDDEEQVRML
jgi:hypothetical protein